MKNNTFPVGAFPVSTVRYDRSEMTREMFGGSRCRTVRLLSSEELTELRSHTADRAAHAAVVKGNGANGGWHSGQE